jgi:hypothetical protein
MNLLGPKARSCHGKNSIDEIHRRGNKIDIAVPDTTRGVSTHNVFGASRSSSNVTGTNFSIGVHANSCQTERDFEGPSWGRNEDVMLVWSTRAPDTAAWLEDADEDDISRLLNENVCTGAAVETWGDCVDKGMGDAIGGGARDGEVIADA